jgi:hypothetical protein
MITAFIILLSIACVAVGFIAYLNYVVYKLKTLWY